VILCYVNLMLTLTLTLTFLSSTPNNAMSYVTGVQGVRKPAVVDVVIKAFLRILSSPKVLAFVAGLKEHTSLACPLIRILMLNEVSSN